MVHGRQGETCKYSNADPVKGKKLGHNIECILDLLHLSVKPCSNRHQRHQNVCRPVIKWRQQVTFAPMMQSFHKILLYTITATETLIFALYTIDVYNAKTMIC